MATVKMLTANVTDILSDPTGTRRFIGIELTGPIDVKHRVNHDQLYAQTQELLRQGGLLPRRGADEAGDEVESAVPPRVARGTALPRVFHSCHQRPGRSVDDGCRHLPGDEVEGGIQSPHRKYPHVWPFPQQSRLPHSSSQPLWHGVPRCKTIAKSGGKSPFLLI